MLAIAASTMILVAFALGRWESKAQASASSLVQAARSVHSLAVERCYAVAIENLSGANAAKGFFPFLKDVRIWTQGDRFWVEAKRNERAWVWGRNAEGSVWMTLGEHRALQIQAEEIGTPLLQICDLYSLELDSLLASFQDRWTLTNHASNELTYTITARPSRNSVRRIGEAILEIDRETKVVRQLSLVRDAGTISSSRVTFTLIDSRPPQESNYEPTGHLTEPYQILTSQHLSAKRTELLNAWFGSSADHWIKRNLPDQTK
jgi:hypothetical protein